MFCWLAQGYSERVRLGSLTTCIWVVADEMIFSPPPGLTVYVLRSLLALPKIKLLL